MSGVSQVCLKKMCFHFRSKDLAFRLFECGFVSLSVDWERYS